MEFKNQSMIGLVSMVIHLCLVKRSPSALIKTAGLCTLPNRQAVTSDNLLEKNDLDMQVTGR